MKYLTQVFFQLKSKLNMKPKNKVNDKIPIEI